MGKNYEEFLRNFSKLWSHKNFLFWGTNSGEFLENFQEISYRKWILRNSSEILQRKWPRLENLGKFLAFVTCDTQKDKEGINKISGQHSKIAKVKNSVTLRPRQGAWVHLIEGSWQNVENDFIFPVLFNTIVEKNLFASKFSPRAGVSRSHAIFMINHNNNIFVQLKRGESLGKLISLLGRAEPRLDRTRGGGVRE